MIIFLITSYLACGVGWLTYSIIKEQSFDLTEGFVPNWLLYLLSLLFWWYPMYRFVKA